MSAGGVEIKERIAPSPEQVEHAMNAVRAFVGAGVEEMINPRVLLFLGEFPSLVVLRWKLEAIANAMNSLGFVLGGVTSGTGFTAVDGGRGESVRRWVEGQMQTLEERRRQLVDHWQETAEILW